MFGSHDRSPASAMVTRVVEQVVPVVMSSIDLDAVLERVDIDALLARIDVDALLERIDVDGLMTRIDLKALLERVDVDGIVSRVDLNALMAQVDVAAIAERAQIGELVASSTSHVAASTLDLARRQLVGLDLIVLRVVNRILRRDLSKLKAGPAQLVATGEPPEVTP